MDPNDDGYVSDVFWLFIISMAIFFAMYGMSVPR